MKLNKKVALITGGAKGIGYAIAKALYNQGATIVIADINEEGAQNAALAFGEGALGLCVDISNVAQIKKMVQAVIDKFDRIDILVNNAGILHTTDIQDVTEQEWDKVMSVNLKGAFFASQQVLPHMKKQKFGRIINISSLAGRNGGLAVGCAYSASKAGLIGVSRNLARKMAPYGITVNVVAPGPTNSDIIKQFSGEKMDLLLNSIPVKRLGEPEEIAAAVTYLASDDAGFVTGAVIDINGGMFMG